MNERLVPLLVVWLLVALVTTACVDARCSRNAECPAGQVCNTTTGACATPECTSDGECGSGRVCEQFACQSGCRTDAECPVDQRCFADHCVPRAEACDCPQAPRFCGVDLNPLSPSVDQTVCVPDVFPSGGVLFFGSVLCSHCQALLDALEVLQAEVGGAVDAPIVFVQEPTIQVGGSTIEGALGGATVAVVADDPDLGIWPGYHADWYHVVLVNRNGCLDHHWGPLAASDVSSALHEEMRVAWLAAREAACTPPTTDHPDAVEPAPEVSEPAPEVVPDAPVDGAARDEAGPEARLEVIPEPAPEAVVELPPEPAFEVAEPAAEPAPEVTEPAPEVVAEVVTEVSEALEAWVEPFELADVCQVSAALPAVVGALVPHFLCKDVNTASGGFGGGFSDVVLREQIWIAYFGTCT